MLERILEKLAFHLRWIFAASCLRFEFNMQTERNEARLVQEIDIY